ncbi:MAG: STAS domain-containing protein [Phycisphaerae bacterium]
MSNLNTQSPLITACRHVESPSAVVAQLAGEIDLHNSPPLRGDLIGLIDEYRPDRLVLNMAAVPYVDSSAIAVMVECLRMLRPAGGKLYLTDLQPRVKALLEMAKLDSIFELVPDEQAALA